MSHALTVARKDVADSVRSLTLWAVIGLFVLLTAAIVGLPPLFSSGDTTFSEALGFAAQISALLVPMIGLTIAYHSITSERESGSLRVLLSLPPSRGEVLVGKLVGRGAVIVLAGVVSVLVTAVVGGVLYGTLPVGKLLALCGSVALMGLSFVGVATGVSAAVSTRGRAMALTVGFYMLTVVLWNLVTGGLRLLATRLELIGPDANPVWLRAIAMLPPNKAFSQVFAGLQSGQLVRESLVPSGALAVVVMIAWVLLPPTLGYLRFRSADLG